LSGVAVGHGQTRVVCKYGIGSRTRESQVRRSHNTESIKQMPGTNYPILAGKRDLHWSLETTRFSESSRVITD
jgi:hypothetical protein